MSVVKATPNVSVSFSQSHKSTILASSSNENAELINLRDSVFFPLFSEISCVGYLPAFLIEIFNCYHVFQLAIVSHFSGSIKLWGNDLSEFYKIIFSFADLGISRKSFSSVLIYSIVFFLLNFFMIILTLYCLFNFRRYHQFKKYQIYIIHFFSLCLLPILIIFESFAFGRSVFHFYFNQSFLYFLVCLINVVLIIIDFLIYKYFITFQTMSPVLIRGWFICWDKDYLPNLVLYSIMISVLSNILNLYSNWLLCFTICFCILLFCFFMNSLWYIPFGFFYTLTKYVINFFLCELSLILSLIAYFKSILPVISISFFLVVFLLEFYFHFYI